MRCSGIARRPLLQVPARCPFVQAVAGMLVEDEPALRPQEPRDLRDRARKVVNVVERAASDDGVEGLVGGELLD